MAESSKKNNRRMNKETRNLFIAIGVLILLFVAVFGVAKHLNNKKQDHSYNNFPFYYDQTQSFWLTQIEMNGGSYNIPFHFHPSEVENVVVEDGVEDKVLSNTTKEIIIAVPGNSSSTIALAGIEISKITGERYHMLKIPTRSAVNEFEPGLPYATCLNASDSIVVINFRPSTDDVITSAGNCINLHFKEGDSIKVADSFAYHLLKIM